MPLPLPRRHPAYRIFSEYLDGDLDEGAHRALEAHLRDCARCRATLASLTATVHALGSLETDRPPGLVDSIIAALRTESPPEPASTRRRVDTAALPALSLVPGPQFFRSSWFRHFSYCAPDEFTARVIGQSRSHV